MPALLKQPVAVNFSKGVDTKSDPWQIPIGGFFSLVNSVFTKLGRLTKRNGFKELTLLTDEASYLTTFNGNLMALGAERFSTFNEGTALWNSGDAPQVSLSTLSLSRIGVPEVFTDSATAANGLVCVLESPGDATFVYAVLDSTTGQEVGVRGTVTLGNITSPFNYPRVFILGTYFVIFYADTPTTVKFFTINTATLVVGSPTAFVAAGTANTQIIEGTVFNNILYLGYTTTAGNFAFNTLTSSLVVGTPVAITPGEAYAMAVTSDPALGGIIWFCYRNGTTSIARVLPYLIGSSSFGVASDMFTQSTVVDAYSTITALSTAGTVTLWVSEPTFYTYLPGAEADTPSYRIRSRTADTTGTTGPQLDVLRSLALASKAFYIDAVPYFLGLYLSFLLPVPPVIPNTIQNTLFLINGLTGRVISRFAYGVAGMSGAKTGGVGFYTWGLPSSTVTSPTTVDISYLLIDGVLPGVEQLPFMSPLRYPQGINQVTFSFPQGPSSSAEIGSNLNFSGGFLWAYDGVIASENNFFVGPDTVLVEPQATYVGIDDGTYTYQVIYKYTDLKGNIFRSATSIPQEIVLSSGPGANGVKITVPTVRLTYKNEGALVIEVYRASVAQPIFYLINISPVGYAPNNVLQLNDPTIDFISIYDALPDSAIIGGTIIYTNGGVVDDVGAPATNIVALWDDRLWLVDAEDPNLLWYSKQVIEGTPVEMSELLTFYVAPSIGGQDPTGPITALAPLDDKFIIFKKASMIYINGSGPDNTGANSNYSQPIAISSVVGCSNQNSIVTTSIGLLFQSDKGIWLLGRDLSTKYIGAPVENYTQFNVNTLTQPLVVSGLVIPETTQVRFTLDTGVTLLYDYFFDQWSIFTGITAQSSTLYNGLHTFIDQSGNVFQETPGVYADGTNPVNMSLQTGWIDLTGLQGYERAYYFYLLGEYFSSHTLQLQLAYDYNPTIEQSTTITPAQVSPIPVSTSNVEQWRVFLQRQKCQAFQLTITEVDAIVGEGLTLSGLNLVIGKKKGYPVRRQNLSVG